MTDADSRFARVTTPYIDAYKCYFEDSDDRVTKGLKQITFQDWLWREAEKGDDHENT